MKRYEIPEEIDETIAMVTAIDNPEDARAFFDSYVAYEVAKGRREDHAIGTVRHNIGCCFEWGQMSEDRIAMWSAVTAAQRVDMDAFVREVMALPGLLRAAAIAEMPWYKRWPRRALDWLQSA